MSKSEKASGDDRKDLLELYRGIRDEKGNGMNRKELRDAVLNLILAGRDTTAQALSWTMFYVTRDATVLDPVRKEIADVLPDGKVTYDNYRSLVHATALFQEVLRLHPSVPKSGCRRVRA
jgi:fatty acid omega-hydroxylase